MWTLVELLFQRGQAKLYAGWPRSAWEVGYMLLTVVALDVLHDAWFYWTHRLLHWRPLYVHVHAIHHRCAGARRCRRRRPVGKAGCKRKKRLLCAA